MAKKTETYVDTSALIAFLDRSDTYHPLFVQLFSNPPPLYTTSLVIAEGQGWFLKRYDRTRALQFMSFVEELKAMKIIEAGKVVIEGATQILRLYSDQDLTLTDACGLWVMKKQKIHSCWSTDPRLGLTRVPLVIYK